MAQIPTTTAQITRPAVVSYRRLLQLNTISHRQVNITAQYSNKELATNSTIAQALIRTAATFSKQAAPTANIHTITIQQHTH